MFLRNWQLLQSPRRRVRNLRRAMDVVRLSSAARHAQRVLSSSVLKPGKTPAVRCRWKGLHRSSQSWLHNPQLTERGFGLDLGGPRQKSSLFGRDFTTPTCYIVGRHEHYEQNLGHILAQLEFIEVPFDRICVCEERSNSSMSIAKTLPRPVSFRKFSKMSSDLLAVGVKQLECLGWALELPLNWWGAI